MPFSLKRSLALLLALTGFAIAAPIDLRLPTENRHLFTGELDKFYMYVDRNFEGQLTKPWEAGSFGFVRTPIRVADEVLLTKFHEGIDIQPNKRDAAGNPLDLVTSIAEGTVVHISPLAGRSNYGKYVVVEHRWENSPVYSLYAHLADITCQPGDLVKPGSVLGRMGYTGAGINRVRSHLHLEIAFMMTNHFDDWQKASGGGINYQGNFNGMNLSGVNPADFFLAHQKNPELQFSQFVASVPVYFKVIAPAKGTPDFVKRYPWISQGLVDGAASWEISFSSTGHPISFVPSLREVAEPTVSQVRPSPFPHRLLTRGLITGEENRASLSPNGKKLVALLMGDFPISASQ